MAADLRDHLRLALIADESESLAFDRLRAIRRLVLLTLACEAWLALLYTAYSHASILFASIAWAFGACAAFGWSDRGGTRALWVAVGLEVFTIAWAFPENANHQFLAVVLMAILLFAGGVHALDRGRSASAAGVAAMRAIVAGGLFWSGVMKLVYGYWFGAEYLSYRISIDSDFARAFALAVPEAELVRLTELGTAVGAGPFRAEAPLLVVASNLTWVLEIALPIGLLVPRTRTVSLAGALALILMIEAGAFEIFFGGLMIGLLLLFAKRERLGVLLGPIGLVYAIWLARVFFGEAPGGGA